MRNVVLIILFSAFSLLGYTQIATEEGLASFYNKRFNGHKTSSGEVYHNTKLTAAHASLPFGTEVLVTNLSNNKSVIVKINDRCSPRRITIDLSRAAAVKIGMIAAGIQRVQIQALNDSLRSLHLDQELADSNATIADSLPIKSDTTLIVENNYSIQVATVVSFKNAKMLALKLTQKYNMPTHYRKVKHRRKTQYKITVGSFTNHDDANEPLKDLKKTYRTAFIIAN